jgi:Short C-terminal domain
MGAWTGQGEQAVADLAARYGVSVDAVRVLLEAIRRGNGSMAQCAHPDFGGHVQWMASGMTMVGDMFDDRLRATVSGLAGELARLLATTPVYAPEPPEPAAGPTGGATPMSFTPMAPMHPANSQGLGPWGGQAWWPEHLGRPSSVGGQNDALYAVFPAARRLAVRHGDGPVLIYDTADQAIGGVSQQQGGLVGTLAFTSQHGTFSVASLTLVTEPTQTAASDSPPPSPPTAPATEPVSSSAAPSPAEAPRATPAPAGAADTDAVLAMLDRLGELHARGVLTDEEFAAKKAELLARL